MEQQSNVDNRHLRLQWLPSVLSLGTHVLDCTAVTELRLGDTEGQIMEVEVKSATQSF